MVNIYLATVASLCLVIVGSSTLSSRVSKVQSVSNSPSQLMKFGNTFPITVKLPTPDISTARKYLSNPGYILESTWPQGCFKPLGEPGSYVIQMGNFNLPGVQSILPEIETKFTIDPNTGFIKMDSGHWAITGSGGDILKDSKFKNSFDIVS